NSPYSLKLRGGLAAAVLALTGLTTAQAEDWPEPVIPKPFGMQLKEHNKNEKNLDQLQELGIHVVRRGLLWHNVEKEKGVYDFSRYDELVNGVEERGMVLLACLALNNEKLYPHVRKPEGRQAFINYTKAIMEHYKGKPIIWEIWNEPNIRTFWGKHGKANQRPYAEEYYNLVKALVPEMKKVDPNCLVLGGSVSGMWKDAWNWTEIIFEMGILETGIDGWSHHPYSLKRPEQQYDGYMRLREMFVKNGMPRDFPIVNSERGFSMKDLKSTNPGGGDVDIDYNTYGKKEALPDYQAWHLVRQYLTDLLADVKFTIWYEWEGSSKEGFPIIQNGKKTLAYFACEHLIKELTGFRLEKRLELGEKNDFILSFRNGNQQKLVVWTSPTGQDSPDLTKKKELEIPVNATGQVTMTDVYGKETTTLPVKNGKITVTLEGGPQYITL
ncbi:MAG: cellulase family glycosylhydrolase, partial [Verrucomicrobiota bacterium]